MVAELDLAGLVRELSSKHSVPGAAVGILRDGVTTTAYHGLADTGTGEVVTSETKFSVGSLTKPMVATVLARLQTRASSHWTTRRRLMSRSSRRPLGRARQRARPACQPFPAAAECRRRVLVLGVPRRRRSAVALCREGRPGGATPQFGRTRRRSCLLGRAIETLTGLVWEEGMQINLFAPAGMDDTTFATKPGTEPRASGHEITAEGLVPVEPSVSRAYGPAGTSVLSTVGDMLRFAALHLEDPSLAPLRSSHAEVRIHAWLDAWCLGWARFDWDGGPLWGWDGLIAGQRSVLRLLPEQRGAVVLMTNSGTGRALYRSLFAELLEPVFGIGMPSLQSSVTRRGGRTVALGGVYAWPDRRWEVTATEAGLVLDGPRGTIEALPIDDSSFLVDATDPDNPTMTFGAFDTGGRPGVLYQMLWGLPREDR